MARVRVARSRLRFQSTMRSGRFTTNRDQRSADRQALAPGDPSRFLRQQKREKTVESRDDRQFVSHAFPLLVLKRTRRGHEPPPCPNERIEDSHVLRDILDLESGRRESLGKLF